jgi:diguanylate cyclase (GGDEF)-like protein
LKSAGNPQDARLRELRFLARLEREGDLPLAPPLPDFEKLMIAQLLSDGCINGLATLGWDRSLPFGLIEAEINDDRRLDLHRLLAGEPLTIKINHKGRIRLSELEQGLQAGRDRDPTGLMLSKRHLDRDLAIAALSARPESPVSVAFLDMNGLKAINDRYGHAAGDAAIKAYLQVLSVLCGDGIEGYRGDGGDEVVLVLRATNEERAARLIRDVLLKLQAERLEGLRVVLTASCGIRTTTDPGADATLLKGEADKEQYRAKTEAKKWAHKPSVIAAPDRLDVLPKTPLAVSPQRLDSNGREHS